jgi:hypothetical protein
MTAWIFGINESEEDRERDRNESWENFTSVKLWIRTILNTFKTDFIVVSKYTEDVYWSLLELKWWVLKIVKKIISQPSSTNVFEMRGVKLKLLQRVRDLALRKNPDKAFWTIAHVTAHIIGGHESLNSNRFGYVQAETTLTFVTRTSLIDTLKIMDDNGRSSPINNQLDVTYDDVVGDRATVFLSFSYSDNFFDLVESIDIKLDKLQMSSESSFFWIDPFVNDQWQALSKDSDWWQGIFRKAIGDIGCMWCYFGTWKNPIPYLKRAWCVFELSCTSTINNTSIMMSRTEQMSLSTALEENYDVLSTLSKIDSREIEAFYPDDKRKIQANIRKSSGGFLGFNKRISNLVRDYIRNDANVDLNVDKRAENWLQVLRETAESEENDLSTEISLESYRRYMIQCEKILGDTGRSFEAKSLFLSKLLKCHKFKEACSLALGEQETLINSMILCKKCTLDLNFIFKLKSLLKEQLNIYMKSLEYSRLLFWLSFVASDGLWNLSNVLHDTEKCCKIALKLGQVNIAEENYIIFCRCCGLVGNTRDLKDTMLKLARLRSWSWNNAVAIKRYDELIRLSTDESAGTILDLKNICLFTEMFLMKNRLILVVISLIGSWYSVIFRLLNLALGILIFGEIYTYVLTTLRNVFNENLEEDWILQFLLTSSSFFLVYLSFFQS